MSLRGGSVFRGAIFRQLFDPASSTYSYLIGCRKTREAVLIDSVLPQADRDAALVAELGLKLTATLETHVHADHVTGASVLRQELGSKVGISAASGARNADLLLRDGDAVPVGSSIVLECRATPGHTSGCMSFVSEQLGSAFTGDALLIRGCGRTDFQQGSAETLFRSVRERILSLPDETLLWPGHDYRGATVSTVAEERAFNPRVGGDVSESDFTVYMRNLHLPHPKLMDEAVPANLELGKVANLLKSKRPEWNADLYRTLNGVFEVSTEWLENHLDEVDIVDVRKSEERADLMGVIPGSRLIPLDELGQHMKSLMDRPVVFVCRSGARSAQACVLLTKAGNAKCANVPGGMIRWNREARIIQDST